MQHGRSRTSGSPIAAYTLRTYPQQTHEMLLDAHNHGFRVALGPKLAFVTWGIDLGRDIFVRLIKLLC